MRQYRTEVVIPPDRALVIHLPDQFPAGRATVTIVLHDSGSTSSAESESDDDHQDIEWWEEFEDEGESLPPSTEP